MKNFLEKFQNQNKTVKKIILVTIALVIFACLLPFMPKAKEEEKPQNEIKQTPTEEKMTGIEKIVDPRDTWTNNVHNNLAKIKDEQLLILETALEEQKKFFEAKFQELAQELENERIARAQQELQSAHNTNNVNKNSKSDTPVVTRRLVRIQADNSSYLAPNEEHYITSGAFADAVLMTGLDVSTGTAVKGDSKPVMLRLTDVAKFSRNLNTEQVVDAIVLGSCTGNISSERAECRLDSLSLKNKDGQIIEKKIEGWVIGGDGRVGIRGKVVDRAGPMVQMSLVNGLLGGMSNFLKQQTMNSVLPVSPLVGQTKGLGIGDAFKAGTADGVSNALDRLAKYSIDRAEQLSPVIIVDAGVKVQLLFKNGILLRDDVAPTVKKIRASEEEKQESSIVKINTEGLDQ